MREEQENPAVLSILARNVLPRCISQLYHTCTRGGKKVQRNRAEYRVRELSRVAASFDVDRVFVATLSLAVSGKTRATRSRERTRRRASEQSRVVRSVPRSVVRDRGGKTPIRRSLIDTAGYVAAKLSTGF